MTRRLLHVIASYDLPYYLRALTGSIASLWPNSDVLVVDNGSTRPEMRMLLDEELPGRPRVHVLRRHDNNEREKTGSLYAAYNAGIDYALANGYDAINFLNDDFELLWQDATYSDALLDHLAVNPMASIVCLLFPRMVGRSDGYDTGPGDLAYRLNGARIVDHGLMLTDFIRRNGFRYATRENELPPHLAGAPLQALLARNPMFAAIAWPTTRRYGRLVGREQHPVGGRYYEPMAASAVAALSARPRDEIPMMENWVRPRLPTLAPFCVTTPDRDWWRTRLPAAAGQNSGTGRAFVDARTPLGPPRPFDVAALFAAVLKPHHPGFFWLWWESHAWSLLVLARRHFSLNLGLVSGMRRMLAVCKRRLYRQ